MRDWILRVYKQDGRCKSGQRLQGEYTYEDRDSKYIDSEVEHLAKHLYPAPKFRIVVQAKNKIVKNLMTGKDVEIAADTPLCCDPSSETYWSL